MRMIATVQVAQRYKSHTVKMRQMMSESARIKQVARCHLLLSCFENEATGKSVSFLMKIFFDGEGNFFLSQQYQS